MNMEEHGNGVEWSGLTMRTDDKTGTETHKLSMSSIRYTWN